MKKSIFILLLLPFFCYSQLIIDYNGDTLFDVNKYSNKQVTVMDMNSNFYNIILSKNLSSFFNYNQDTSVFCFKEIDTLDYLKYPMPIWLNYNYDWKKRDNELNGIYFECNAADYYVEFTIVISDFIKKNNYDEILISRRWFPSMSGSENYIELYLYDDGKYIFECELSYNSGEEPYGTIPKSFEIKSTEDNIGNLNYFFSLKK